MGDPRTRDEIARSLASRIAAFVGDEPFVIDAIVARLEERHVRFGALDLETTRDWQRETDDEAIELLLLRACKRASDARRGIITVKVAPSPAVVAIASELHSEPLTVQVATSAVAHAWYCHATHPTPERPDGGCICGAITRVPR